MLVSKNANICVTPNENAKICATPNASQWNIGCVGSPCVGARVGHVHFMLFVSISFALGSQRERSFQWNMSLRVHVYGNLFEKYKLLRSIEVCVGTLLYFPRWAEGRQYPDNKHVL